MTRIEEANYGRQETYKVVPSEISRGHTTRIDTGFVCPVCGFHHDQPLQHLQKTECRCGTLLQRAGNCLILEREIGSNTLDPTTPADGTGLLEEAS